MPCLRARVLAYRCSSSASFATRSANTAAMAVCLGTVGTGNVELWDDGLSNAGDLRAHDVEKELAPDGSGSKTVLPSEALTNTTSPSLSRELDETRFNGMSSLGMS